ncbi:transposase [Paenochrobactrum gallinarii]|uniref:Transposase n=1 Tax=Paenochrobactrum gallinarii TaxID=643673 RepID=A0A841M005_9HYPH|nr:transposase [Paenochrobactrum gallinarii]
MSDLFLLSDAAWNVIEPHLPKNQPGARRDDDRRVISGILHALKVGCRWRAVPAEYGPANRLQPISPLGTRQKRGRGRMRLARRAVEEQAKSIAWPIIAADRSLSA